MHTLTCPRSVIAGAVVVVVLAGGCVGPDDGSGAACGTGEPAPSAGADDGEVFTNSQGTYRMTVDGKWTADHGRIVEGLDAWYLGPAPETPDSESEALNPERSFTLEDIQRETFQANVNVLTQRTDGQTLDEYLALSEQSAPPGFTFTSRETIEGVNHPELGVLEYREAGAGFTLCFLGVVAVRGDRAVVATLTAPDDDFPALRQQVEPYLLTLELT